MVFNLHMANLVGAMERNNYRADFDAQSHLTEFYSNPSSPTDVYSNFMVTNLHQFFHSVPLPQTELKVLEYGCGPVIANVISASLYASSVVLAEYTPQSRALIEQWLKRDETFFFDWSPHFKYIVQTLEGRSEAEAKEREETLRQKIKAVVPCNLTQDPPLPKEHTGPYDILISCLVIDVTATSIEEYEDQWKKFSLLVKKGGYLLIVVGTSSTDEKFCFDHYTLKGKNFNVLLPSQQYLFSLLKKFGFSIDNTAEHPSDIPTSTFNFISAKKII